MYLKDGTMVSTEDDFTLAEAAYLAHCGARDFKNLEGKPLMKWGELSEVLQMSWMAAVNAVRGVTTTHVAKVCHEVNRAYCLSVGDTSQSPWNEAPDWQRDSCTNGVESMLKNNSTPEQSHENWLAFKAADGWVYGEIKDAEKKTHPCMRPYGELPEEQRKKDSLFHAVVNACRDWVVPSPRWMKVAC